MNEDITVLIVDAYPNFRQALADVLAFIAPSWQIVEVGDGQQGLTLAQRLRPDLILLDLHMLVMNGYEMAVACQRDPTLAAIPRVLLTSEEIDHPLVRRLQLLCHAVVSKPLSISDLASALERVLIQNPVVQLRNAQSETAVYSLTEQKDSVLVSDSHLRTLFSIYAATNCILLSQRARIR